MEPNENQLSSYYLHQQQQSTTSTIAPTTAVTTTSSPTNGLLPNTDGSHMVYPHSVPSAVSSQLEPPKRKRGRPRKYGTPEQALAAKKAATFSSHSFSPKDKKDHGLGSASASSSYTGSSKKSQSFALGNAGQGFTPHVITVSAGEDVGQKIMLFMQQSRREMCILSACGSISNVSLRQPATSGGNITYEGRFEIISLSGSYVRTELGGRTGGLSVCLSNSDGEIVGGGVGGPLKAAGPVQVIVGTFFMDTKKDAGVGVKGDASGSKLPSLVGESVSSLGFHQAAAVESSSGNPIRGNDDHQGIGGSHFMIQQRGVHVTPAQPTDWGGRPGYELTGRTGDGHGAHHSPENGDY